MGRVIGCQVSNFPIAAWLVHCLQEESGCHVFVLGQRDNTTVYDVDHNMHTPFIINIRCRIGYS